MENKLQEYSEQIERAHHNISFDSEKRRDMILKDYGNELNEDIKTIIELGVDPERYTSQYKKYFITWIGAKSRCISSFITGRSNFPVRRAEKYNRWEHNHYETFRAWRKKAIYRISKKPALSVSEELDYNISKLETLEKKHIMMKTVNAYLRKNKEATPQDLVKEINIDLMIATKLLTPLHGYSKGFQHFSLTNNRANIKNTESRVYVLRHKVDKKGAVEDITPANCTCKVLRNYEADRIQLIFEGKPEDATRQLLKSNGFKWSPKNTAWQRKLTNNAMYTLKHYVVKHLMGVTV